MPKKVVWSHLAEQDFDNILSFINLKWNAEIALKFISLVNHNILLVSQRPKLFPLINRKNKVRKCVLTKHNSLFYIENKIEIVVLRIYDTRQDPKKLKV